MLYIFVICIVWFIIHLSFCNVDKYLVHAPQGLPRLTSTWEASNTHLETLSHSPH